MTDRWPYPGDLPLARARRVALAYRAELQSVDSARCTRLDDQFVAWGQAWMLQKIVSYDLEDWLEPAQAAEIAMTSTANLRRLRRAGRLKGIQGADGVWRYQAKDVLKVISITRRRK